MIQRLGSDVISKLRSGVALSSLSQCVEELVLNSIDAGSSSITVDVDISTISFEVSDNGTGVRQNDLKNVGQRYFTSKCHSLEDLKNAASYGFRGEALASLGKICQKIEIVSRHKMSSRTFCKLVQKGRDVGVYESTSPRPRHGTTVKVYGVFDTLPVRQKLISDKVDLEQIRRHVLGVVLINPGVSILVRNKENGTSLLQTHACTSTLSVISQVFGCGRSKAFKPVFQTSGVHTITGYISLEGFPNRNFQFFYVNKQLVLKTRFHNVAHHILSRAITGLIMVDDESANQDEGLCSPKKLDKYPSFVLNVECPCNTYDITFDPKKTLVEFQNWDEPITCLKECLNNFLKREGIFNDEFFNIQTDSQESCPSLSQEFDLVKPDLEVSVECPNATKRTIKASDLRRSLHSSTAKRKINGNAAYSVGIMSSSIDDSFEHVTSEKDIDGKRKSEELSLIQDCSVNSDGSAISNKEGTSCHDNSSLAVLNRLGESKRSIVTKLQRYTPGISRHTNYVNPSESNFTFSSSASSCNEGQLRKTERTLNMKLESLNSYDGKKKCLSVSQEGEEVSGMGDVQCKIRKFIAPKQPNDSRTPVQVQQLKNMETRGYMRDTSEDTLGSLPVRVSRRSDSEIVDSQTNYCNTPCSDGGPAMVTDHASIIRDKPFFVNPRNFGSQTNRNITCSSATGHVSVTKASTTATNTNNQQAIKDKDSRIVGSQTRNSVPMIGSSRLTDHRLMVKADGGGCIDFTDDKPAMKDSDWLLQHNPHDGRPVYINPRTGNTSMVIPWHCKPELLRSLQRKSNDSMKQNNSTKLRPFRKFASHLSHNFTPWLPRSVSSGEASVARREQSSAIGDMLDQWVNPVFERNETLVADTSFTNGSKTSLKPHCATQPFKFTKDCFNKMKVISQVDNKFILCFYQGDEDNFLVVVDQHAAHERVRLETFTKDLYINCQIPGGKVAMKSSPLSTPCELIMSDHDVHLMQAFRVQLQQVGITFTDPSSSGTLSSVRIKTVPSVFLAREFSDNGEKLCAEIKNCIEDLIKEQIEVMLSTKGATTTALPKAITKVLNSQACHGAIRFGDSLSNEECVSLMTSLSTCDLPFQCAHGRPSMIPLMSTTLIRKRMSQKATSLPQISKIKEHFKEKFV